MNRVTLKQTESAGAAAATGTIVKVSERLSTIPAVLTSCLQLPDGDAGAALSGRPAAVCRRASGGAAHHAERLPGAPTQLMRVFAIAGAPKLPPSGACA